jgi:hypothetical protein
LGDTNGCQATSQRRGSTDPAGQDAWLLSFRRGSLARDVVATSSSSADSCGRLLRAPKLD